MTKQKRLNKEQQTVLRVLLEAHEWRHRLLAEPDETTPDALAHLDGFTQGIMRGLNVSDLRVVVPAFATATGR
jgi:hypothetical protein